MISYELTIGDRLCSVSVDPDEPGGMGEIEYAGDRKAIAIVRQILPNCYGATAHLLGELCSEADLISVMTLAGGDLMAFSPQLMTGNFPRTPHGEDMAVGIN